MKANPYQQAEFLISAAKLQQLPDDSGIEVAFAGRSNAGKSSALNAITGRKRLAHISKTPGRTQLINLFTLDETRRLVDLPGYGYAKVPLEMKRKWQHTLELYLETRECLQGMVLVMDIRHPLKEFDKQMINWASLGNLRTHILLTKCDKLKRGPANSTLLTVRKEVGSELVSAQLFSSTNRTGVEQAREKLNEWYGFEDESEPGA